MRAKQNLYRKEQDIKTELILKEVGPKSTSLVEEWGQNGIDREGDGGKNVFIEKGKGQDQKKFIEKGAEPKEN